MVVEVESVHRLLQMLVGAFAVAAVAILFFSNQFSRRRSKFYSKLGTYSKLYRKPALYLVSDRMPVGDFRRPASACHGRRILQEKGHEQS
jgi:hypothetical protein